MPKRFRFADSRLLPLAVIVVTLATLGGVILVARQYIRGALRSQIAGRDAQLLYQLWKRQSQVRADPLVPIEQDAQGLLLEAVLDSWQGSFDGFLGVRLFSSEGGRSLTNFPPWAPTADLPKPDLAEVRLLRPTSHFDPTITAAQGFQVNPTLIPLLDVFIPLHREGEGTLLGVAQVVLDGTGIAREFAELDRTLAAQAWRGFLGAGFIVTLALLFAFHQLRMSNRLLAERTRRLLDANRELTLAAKTSAIGSVSAHLIHGLKNPLSGLRSFITGKPVTGTDTEWKTAMLTTQRMQDLVSEVVRVLAEEKGEFGYEVDFEELTGMVRRKAAPMAERAGVLFCSRLAASGTFSNRDANLVLLILENLIANAIQATPPENEVTLSIEASSEQIVCEVTDQGPGFSNLAREQLFKPCQSSKNGGSGIGLAISKQLANYLGAALELKRSTTNGSTIELALPRRLYDPEFVGADERE